MSDHFLKCLAGIAPYLPRLMVPLQTIRYSLLGGWGINFYPLGFKTLYRSCFTERDAMIFPTWNVIILYLQEVRNQFVCSITDSYNYNPVRKNFNICTENVEIVQQEDFIFIYDFLARFEVISSPSYIIYYHIPTVIVIQIEGILPKTFSPRELIWIILHLRLLLNRKISLLSV